MASRFFEFLILFNTIENYFFKEEKMSLKNEVESMAKNRQEFALTIKADNRKPEKFPGLSTEEDIQRIDRLFFRGESFRGSIDR